MALALFGGLEVGIGGSVVFWWEGGLVVSGGVRFWMVWGLVFGTLVWGFVGRLFL